MVVMSYLTIMMGVAIWVLRIMVAVTTTLGKEFALTAFNINVEVILLFVTLFCFIFIVKRKIIGALVYMLTYVGYFGTYLYTKLSSGNIMATDYPNILVSILSVIIPIIIFLDIGLNKNQKNFSLHKKTDWFYKNEEFDRKFDERADRNQYKF